MLIFSVFKKSLTNSIIVISGYSFVHNRFQIDCVAVSG